MKSDGGAAGIAGFDLSLNGAVIVSLFAAAGWGQLMMPLIAFALWAATRQRTVDSEHATDPAHASGSAPGEA